MAFCSGVPCLCGCCPSRVELERFLLDLAADAADARWQARKDRAFFDEWLDDGPESDDDDGE